jgi:osmoprotectant transport system substrate-binding protein
MLVFGLMAALILAACGGAPAAQNAAGTAQVAAGGAAATAQAAAGSVTATAQAAAPTVQAAAGNVAATAQAAVPPAGAKGTVKIGSKDFTEAILVAELYAQLLEDTGYTIERKLNLGATPIAQAAIVKGEIDLYPEYTSTGLQEVLKITDRIPDAKAIHDRVKSEYEKQFQLTWLQPAPFNNTNTFAVTKATADKFGLKTYTDLFAKAAELRLGGPAEFTDRQDTKGLEQAYSASVGTFKEFKPLGTGTLRYDALKSGEVEVIVAFGTDGRIAGDELVVLQDDKNFYPIYNIAPVVRMDTLATNADIAPTLDKLAPLLTDQVMAGLNFEVDGPAKREVKDVARDFLEQSGLLTK